MAVIILRCLIVSLVLAVLASVIATSVVLAPPSGTVMTAVDGDEPDPRGLAQEDYDDYLMTLPTRTVTGMERFMVAFTHPQYWHFQRRAMTTLFAVLLMGTLLASGWNLRAARLRQTQLR